MSLSCGGAVYVDADFRAMFPPNSPFNAQTGNPPTYVIPASTLQMYFDLGQCWIRDGSVFLCCCTQAILYLMTAHLYTLGQRAATGKQGGFETSATIDKVSVSRMAPPATDMFGWWLAQTPFGQQIAAMLEVAAVGGLSFGGLPERSAFRKVGGVFL